VDMETTSPGANEKSNGWKARPVFLDSNEKLDSSIMVILEIE